MKKRLLLFLISFLPMFAYAYDFEVNGLCYNLVSLDDKVVCLTRNADGYSGDLVIPSTITVGDYTFKVDSIADYACSGCYGLNSITIEEGIKKIGKEAFYSTSFNRVEYIKIPKSLEYVDRQAFGCMVPTKVYIADLASWCNVVFSDYYYVGNPLELNINSYKRFGKNVCLIYINNERTDNLIIPNGVERVNDNTFKASNLSSVTFPNSVKYVNGFYESYIEKAILGNQTDTIGFAAFRECNYLKTIHLPNSVTCVKNDAFYGCTSLEDLVLGEGIIVIGKSAFSGCTSIPVIIIKDNCKTIDSWAFNNCSKAKKLYLGSAVATIGEGAFDGCANLDSIIVSATTPPSIAENTFSASVKLISKLIVPKGCKEKYLQDPNWSTFNNIYEYDGNITDLANTKYLLSYVVDGEAYKTYRLNYGDAITPEPAPIKEGHTFSGWSDIPETMPAHDVTVTGTFTPAGDMLNGYEYVDLGLPSGKCWATTNYGSDTPEGYGTYLEWGNNSIVSSSWGTDWMTPSFEDIHELQNHCTWVWDSKNGINGYTVKGKNDKSIFLPACGYMMEGQSSAKKVGQWVYYWTSTKSGEMARIIMCTSTDVWYGDMNTSFTKLPIRPITKKISSDIKDITSSMVDERQDIVGVYDIQGHKLNGLSKGINVVKYKDGSTKKIVK